MHLPPSTLPCTLPLLCHRIGKRLSSAGVAEQADAAVSKTVEGQPSCRFESDLRHHVLPLNPRASQPRPTSPIFPPLPSLRSAPVCHCEAPRDEAIPFYYHSIRQLSSSHLTVILAKARIQPLHSVTLSVAKGLGVVTTFPLTLARRVVPPGWRAAPLSNSFFVLR